VAEAYRAAGLEPPRRVVWLGSPYAGAIGAWLLAQDWNQTWHKIWDEIVRWVEARVRDQIGVRVKGRTQAQVRDQGAQVHAEVWVRVGRQIEAQVRDQVRTQVRTQVRNQIRAQIPTRIRRRLRAQLGTRIKDRLWNGILTEVRDQVGRQVEDQIKDQVWTRIRAQVPAPAQKNVWTQTLERIEHEVTREVQGQIDRRIFDATESQRGIGDLAVYDASGRLGMEGCEYLAGAMTVARSAGWWWPFHDAVILTERPTELHRDHRGRLHCETGPAVRYPDGFAVYAWHGVRVPQHIVTGEPTGADWLAEDNAEIRRVVVERLGYQRLLDEVQAEKRHTDDYGTLWRIPDPDGNDEDIWLVDVVNSTPEPDGSYKRYVLRVPTDMPTAHAAVAWTFNLTSEDYRPLAQT